MTEKEHQIRSRPDSRESASGNSFLLFDIVESSHTQTCGSRLHSQTDSGMYYSQRSFKADDPDPVGKQQAKAALGELNDSHHRSAST